MFEIQGTIVAVPAPETGMGQKGPWGKQTIIVQYNSGEFVKKIALENRKKYEEFGKLRVGQTGTFKCDVDCREYNGKYYTNITCFHWDISQGEKPAF